MRQIDRSILKFELQLGGTGGLSEAPSGTQLGPNCKIAILAVIRALVLCTALPNLIVYCNSLPHALEFTPMDFLHNWIVPPGAMVEPWTYVLTAFSALMIMAVSKGGFGGGVGIISVPMMFYVAPTQFVLGLWVPVLVVCDLATIHQYPKEWNPRAFFRLAPGVMLGIILVTAVVHSINPLEHSPQEKQLDHFLRVGCGVVSLAFVALQVRPKGADTDAEPWKPSWAISLPAGLIAGITTMIANAAGPIITMFLLPQKMEKRVFVGTCGRFYFIFNSIKIPFAMYCGWTTWATLRYGAWMMLVGPLGVVLGRWLNNHLSAKWFEIIVRCSLVFAGIKLIYDGLK